LFIVFAITSAVTNKVEYIVMVGKISGLLLSFLWSKVHKILGQCRPFVLSNALARLSMSRFV